ncbi:MAG: rod-binding protein [Phycisphaerae bacterium]
MIRLNAANPSERLPAAISAQNLRGADATTRPKSAREAATKMVSQLFFVPMLEAMRELPFGKEFGSGGRTEEIFGEQLDQQLADKIAKADRSGLVDLVERKISKRNDVQPAQEVTGPGSEQVAWNVRQAIAPRGTANA